LAAEPQTLTVAETQLGESAASIAQTQGAFGWLFGWLAGWLAGCLAGWLACWLGSSSDGRSTLGCFERRSAG